MQKHKFKLFVIDHKKGTDIVRGPKMIATYLSELGANNDSLDKKVGRNDAYSASDAISAYGAPVYIEERNAQLELDENGTFNVKIFWEDLPDTRG